MTRIYKLTRPDQTTYGGFRYEVGRTYTFPGTGPLCSAGWSHAYTSPQLAVLLNPIHADYRPFTLWTADGEVGATDHGLKVGCSRLTILHEIPVPTVPVEQCVTFALYCALAVYAEPKFVRWAEAWLAGTDRTGAAAWAAALDLQGIARTALLPWEPER